MGGTCGTHEVNPQKNYGQRIRRKDAFCIPMNHEGIEQMHGLSQTKYKEAAATVNTIAQLVSTGL